MGDLGGGRCLDSRHAASLADEDTSRPGPSCPTPPPPPWPSASSSASASPVPSPSWPASRTPEALAPPALSFPPGRSPSPSRRTDDAPLALLLCVPQDSTPSDFDVRVVELATSSDGVEWFTVFEDASGVAVDLGSQQPHDLATVTAPAAEWHHVRVVLETQVLVQALDPCGSGQTVYHSIDLTGDPVHDPDGMVAGSSTTRPPRAAAPSRGSAPSTTLPGYPIPSTPPRRVTRASACWSRRRASCAATTAWWRSTPRESAWPPTSAPNPARPSSSSASR